MEQQTPQSSDSVTSATIQSININQLKPNQLAELARKVAELLRAEVRIERERQG